MKAYVLPETDKLCRVERGDLQRYIGVKPEHPCWAVLLDEDAALREAWERLWHYYREKNFSCPPDGYYIARPECREPNKHEADGWSDEGKCEWCKDKLTLIPLAEAGLEEIPKYHEAHDWPNQFLVGRPDIPALVVVQEKECEQCHGSSLVRPYPGEEKPTPCSHCCNGKVERVEVYSRVETKAYALPKTDKLCRVQRGEPLWFSDTREWEAGTITEWRLFQDTRTLPALREAWERLPHKPECIFWYQQDNDGENNPCDCPAAPDGLYIARGPGVVECETCKGKVQYKGCYDCNPKMLEHPTLIPLAEAELEEVPHLAQCIPYPDVFQEELAKRDIPALIVVREERCRCTVVPGGFSSDHCTGCRGTGKVERVEVHER